MMTRVWIGDLAMTKRVHARHVPGLQGVVDDAVKAGRRDARRRAKNERRREERLTMEDEL